MTANRVFIDTIVLSSINIIILIPQKEDRRPLVKLQIPKASCSLQPQASSAFLTNLSSDTYCFHVLFKIFFFFRNFLKN